MTRSDNYTAPEMPCLIRMKTSAVVIFLISSLWLLVIHLQPFERVLCSLFSWPRWLEWLWWFPNPPPIFGLTWRNSWPVAFGFAGLLVASALLAWVSHSEHRKERDEI